MSENIKIATSFVLIAAWCFWVALTLWRNRSKILFESGKVLITYASQTGQAKSNALAHLARQNDAILLPLNKVTQEHLTTAAEAHFYLSTYGDGEAPDNGRGFVQSLNQFNQDTIQRVKFSVTAFGDSRYPDFCAFGKSIYDKFLQSGAQPLSSIRLIDANEPKNINGSNVKDAKAIQNQTALDQTFLDKKTGFHSATLVESICLNPKSESPGLYQLLFDVQDLNWQPGDLLEVLPTEKNQSYAPRTYSIASAASELLDKKYLKLIVRLHINPDGSYGKVSGFLTQQCKVGASVRIRVRKNPACQLEAEQKPLLLIGAGSGLAGLLGHIEQRSLIKDAGPVWLIYGERDPKHDQPLSEQLTRWQQQRIINRMDKTYSRQNESAKYVQDVLLQNDKELKQFIKAQGDIYVCGRFEGMGQAVDQSLRNILGKEILTQMLEAGRYHRDLY